MMLGTSSSSLIAANSADATSAAAVAAAAAAEAHDSGGASGGSAEVGGAGTIPGGFSDEEKGRIDEGERGAAGGNRWPRQETLTLLKIRSEMGVAFRDSSLKGPLWEEVSRKMAELGYQRSAKKCKEKFENVYKYHKRTKEGRASKPDGKTYRFFEQLEALENNPSLPLPPTPRQQPQAVSMATTAMAVPMPASANPPIAPHVTVSSPNPVSFSPSVNNPIMSSLPSSQPQLPPQPPPMTNSMNPPQNNSLPTSHLNLSTSLLSDSTSSSTSSDEDIGRRHKRKRKFKDFFERLMKDVIDKQEELQRRFLETLEKRERDRMIREEAWRVQEMARMNRELDLLAQERSMSAAKDAAVMQFLQKITGQQNLQTAINKTPQIPASIHLQPPENPSPQPISVSLPHTPVVPAPVPAAAATAPPVTQLVSPPVAASVATPTRNVDTSKADNGGENFMPASSSRWPKTEVQALIRLRTNLDVKYQESGPKGPLWEEISAGMSKLGYNRSAKRCKEKWENINKYFKKVKESNKKRPEDSKTCPYFHQLDALYKEKAKVDVSYSSSYTNAIKPENPMVPIMARPEQQWPLPQDQHGGHQQDTAMEDHESDNIDQNDHDDDDGDDEDEEDEGDGYEIVTNKASSVPTTAAE